MADLLTCGCPSSDKELEINVNNATWDLCLNKPYVGALPLLLPERWATAANIVAESSFWELRRERSFVFLLCTKASVNVTIAAFASLRSRTDNRPRLREQHPRPWRRRLGDAASAALGGECQGRRVPCK